MLQVLYATGPRLYSGVLKVVDRRCIKEKKDKTTIFPRKQKFINTHVLYINLFSIFCFFISTFFPSMSTIPLTSNSVLHGHTLASSYKKLILCLSHLAYSPGYSLTTCLKTGRILSVLNADDQSLFLLYWRDSDFDRLETQRYSLASREDRLSHSGIAAASGRNVLGAIMVVCGNRRSLFPVPCQPAITTRCLPCKQ